MAEEDRVVTLVDMDCFYCQVEAREKKELQGKPMAVVQYNAWKGGGIIAVSYEARAAGVRRNMRGDEAKEKCPEIALVPVPTVREKADLSKYREASKEVLTVLLSVGAVVERASIDEAYLDLTKLVDEMLKSPKEAQRCPNTHVVGRESVAEWLDEEANLSHEVQRLSAGAAIVEDMRAKVFAETGFRCSAGVARNKMLAKLACGLHKPNAQTVLPSDAVPELFTALPLTKLRGLGGKLGEAVTTSLGVKTAGELAMLPVAALRVKFDEKTSRWLHDVSKGIDVDPVKERELPKSIGCSKNFLGPKMLETKEQAFYWFSQLAEEVCERLAKDRESNGRLAKGFTASLSIDGRGHFSRAGALTSYDPAILARQAMQLVSSLNESTDPNLWRPKLKNVSLAATKFQPEGSRTTQASIISCFNKAAEDTPPEDDAVNIEELIPSLEEFDHSVLDLLPAKVKEKALKRIKELEQLGGKDGALPDGATGPSREVNTSPQNDHGEVVASTDDKILVENCLTNCDESAMAVKEEKVMSSPERVTCERCSRLISPFELPEHLDYHLARDLQNEMSREEGPIQVKTIYKEVKRKRKEEDTEKVADKKQRHITSFFKKV